MTRRDRDLLAKHDRVYAVGDRIVMRAGTRVGMGKLREDTPAVIDQIQSSPTGAPFYGVRWADAKGKARFTWWAPGEE